MYTNTPRTISTLGAALLLVAGLQGPAHGGASELSTVSTTSAEIQWQPLVATDGWTLTVAGEERWIRTQFGPGESPAFQPTDESGQPLPDGSYTWELRAVRKESGGDRDAATNGRDEAAHASRAPVESPQTLTQSGAFTVVGGAIVATGTETEAQAQTGGEGAVGGDPEELVIAEDLIVQGSNCVGVDCVNGESFGADTIRLKENNLRIHFLDTSNSGSFPSNDWRLVANDQANGGRNIFYLEDATSGREVFSVEAGAPSSSLYVDDGGRVGFGTSTPVLQLQTTDGNTPALRLEQDGSSGFTPQTWDVAGNEANFFVRDVTGGSRLPFRIRPGAPTSSVDIGNDGNVGLGTAAPADPLHISRSDQPTIRLEDTGDGITWRFGLNSGGNFVINDIADIGVAEMRISPAGQVFVNGTQVHPDYVFDESYELMELSEVDRFVRENKHLPGVVSSHEAEGTIDLSSFPLQLLEKVEELTLYAIEQERRLEETSAELASVKAELETLKSTVDRRQ